MVSLPTEKPAQTWQLDAAPATPPGDRRHDAAARSRAGLGARRLRTLLLTAPLDYLEANKLRRGESWAAYDLRTLQLHALQTVVDHMGLLEGGISRLAVAEVLGDLARTMAPGHDRAEHATVAQVVIDWLLNAEGSDVFAPAYVDLGPDGAAVRRQATIEILRERQEPDGSLVLRASVEAINLLLGVLSEDVADAQRAEERLLEDYIAAGRLDAAVDQARRAQLRSIQYAEQVSRWLGSARQDLARLDWSGSIRAEMDGALAHIRGRLEDETRMRDRVEATRRELADTRDEGKLEAVARILSDVNDCHDRHTRLHGLLLDAGPTFRREQERQRFARPPSVHAIALRQTLDEVLRLPLAQLVAGESGPADAFFRALAGPVAPAVLDLARLAGSLNAPAREGAGAAPEIPEAALVAAGPTTRFTPAVAAEVERLLVTTAREPRRLSALLAEVRRQAPAEPELAAELVRLRALEAYAPDGRAGGASAVSSGRAPERLASSSDGSRLDDAAYRGDDLRVGWWDSSRAADDAAGAPAADGAGGAP